MAMINTNTHKQVTYTPEIESGASEVEMRLFNKTITKTNGLCQKHNEMIMRITVTDDVSNFLTNEDRLVYFMFKEQWSNFFFDEIIVINGILIVSI